MTIKSVPVKTLSPTNTIATSGSIEASIDMDDIGQEATKYESKNAADGNGGAYSTDVDSTDVEKGIASDSPPQEATVVSKPQRIATRLFSTIFNRKKASSDTKDTKEDAIYRDFKFGIASNFFFLFGAVLYLVGSVWSHQFAVFAATLDPSSLEADDDYTWSVIKNETNFEDDYVFSVPLYNRPADQDAEYWVSLSQMIFFCAALSLLISGVIDFIHYYYDNRTESEQEKTVWSWCCNDNVIRAFSFLKPLEWAAVFLILGGLFGVISAMLFQNAVASASCNSVSIHFYLLEASIVLGGKRINEEDLSNTKLLCASYLLRSGSLLFFVGTSIDVTLSYIYLFPQFTYSIPLSIWELFAQTLWMLCALLYITAEILIHHVHRKK